MADKYDYIVVGSGAGGGPLAARLAEAGRRVLLLEAGGNTAAKPGPDLEVSQVPSFHGLSTERQELSWQFFVKHYENPVHPDPKANIAGPEENPDRGGIFYPRASGLGGCTIHNAMITIAGPDSDWDDLADLVNDDSWRASRMKACFKRLEYNEYSGLPQRGGLSRWRRAWNELLWFIGLTPDMDRGGHGFDGWLHTSLADVSLGLHDKQLLAMLKAALLQSDSAGLDRAGTLVRRFLKGEVTTALDPNHQQTRESSPEGVVLIPLAVCGKRTNLNRDPRLPDVQTGRRSSPRERLRQVQIEYPDRLTIQTDSLVTRVLFNEASPPRAIGVELQRGRDLYHAHPVPSPNDGTVEQVFVEDDGEVILCGGAFNTPQLLMLSGIGDREHLAEHGIECRVDLPGVGRNLQDRYEVTVVSEMKDDFKLLEGATFEMPGSDGVADPHLEQWRKFGTGLYTSNGAVMGIFKRSRPELAKPDLFLFGIPLPFEGYRLKYSEVGHQHKYFTWAILKAHTNNAGGTVRLRSADPRRTPEINFRYFHDGESTPPRTDPDLEALVDGVQFVRGIAQTAGAVVASESYPGPSVADDTQQIREWIRQVAWGHHACGTCRMGPDDDPLAVLDSRLRVRQTCGLRVVDASIFPKIPGYFLVSNIYMASEKAALDILSERGAADCSPTAPQDRTYPTALHEVEAKAVARRRGGKPPSNQEWLPETTGLALSGGGIRSATFNLGILQALAGRGLLPKIDFLSTVSGGGYIGAFLGRCYDRLQHRQGGRDPAAANARVAEQLTASDSKAVDWLRRHGNYIAPQGHSDWRLDLATYLRNFLSVHFVVGMLILTVFGLANAVRYGLFDPATQGLGLVLMSKSELPLGRLLSTLLGPFFSPWFTLFELILLVYVVPLIVGYWVVSQDRHERFHPVSVTLLFLIGTTLLWLGVRDGGKLAPLAVGLSLFSALIRVEMAWRRGRDYEAAVGTGGPQSQRLRTRNYLTYDLGLMISVAGLALAFAVVDTVGHGLHQWIVESSRSYAAAFASVAAAFAALIPMARSAASLFLGRAEGTPPPAVHVAIRRQIMAGFTAVVLIAVPLVLYSFTAHAAYQGGTNLIAGVSLTLFAAAMTAVLSLPSAITLVNRSSLAIPYSARLSRSYLGASNPLRHRAEGANITEVIPGDDVASITEYQPHAAGGPIHLINVMVNQTVEFSSLQGNRQRQGENMAVSALGLSIGRTWHSVWGPHAALQPICAEGDIHPLCDQFGDATPRLESLSLGQWTGISGAAVGPARGRHTALGTALLFGLANVRTGYWWDSGLGDRDRVGFRKRTFLRRFLNLVPRVLRSQCLLLSEWVGRFSGPWVRYWNLSDGGFFDNTGAYELVRRRVPRLIVCDASADPQHQFESFAEFVRKVRIDFGAEVAPLTTVELDALVPKSIRDRLGTPDDLRLEKGRSSVHGSLSWVHYQGGSKSILLYLKASMTGDEPADVMQYRAVNDEFPHQGTSDQIFDEAQWESYRKLGQHVATGVLSESDWFWSIPL